MYRGGCFSPRLPPIMERLPANCVTELGLEFRRHVTEKEAYMADIRSFCALCTTKTALEISSVCK